MPQRPLGPLVSRKRTPGAAVLVLALALVPAFLGAQPTARGDLHVVSQGPDYFEAVLDVPPPVLLPVTVGGREAVRLELPGWTSAGPEGAPLLALRSLAVAVPEGEEVRVSVQGEDAAVISGVLVAPFWRGLFEDPEQDAFPAQAASNEVYGRDAFWPDAIHEVGAASYLRDLRLLPIDVRPARYNPVSGELQVYRRLRIRVETVRDGTGASAVAPKSARPDAAGWDEIYRSAAMNYPSEMAYRALRSRDAVRHVQSGDYFDDAEWWLAMDVDGRGVFAISYEDLLAAGVPAEELAALDPSTLRLFNGGGLALDANVSVLETASWMQECALLVKDGGDGRLSSGDRLLFYGNGAEGWSDHLTGAPQWGGYLANLHTGSNVYWLTWGGGFESGAALRMEPSDGAPEGEDVYTPESYRERIHVEENHEWEPSLRTRGVSWERWWWQLLTMADGGGRVYSVNIRDVVTEAPCRLKARFWGLTFSWGCLDHHMMSLSVNGSAPFLKTARGGSRIDFDTTAVWAVEGQNQLVARIPVVVDRCLTDYGKTRVDESYFAWFELEYSRRFRARGGELAFDWMEGTSGPVRFKAGGLSAPDVRVLDVTDRYKPRLVTGWTASADTVAFQAELDGSRRDYYIVSDSAIRTPSRSRLRSPGKLRGRTAPVDYIVIAAEELIEAAEVLGDWRKGHLLGVTDGGGEAYVEVVDVADVYDEFSWGMVDPVAIRNFLELRFKSAPAGERPPSYALMFGDATWDFRDYAKFGVANAVPSYDEGFDRLTRSQFSSDDFLVLFEGPGDPFSPPGDRFLDMAVGRLSPESASEAADLVTTKIIGFELEAEPGPWRCKVLLAADDACIEGTPEPRGHQHTEQADDLSKRHIPKAFDREKIYLIEYGAPGCVDIRKPEARLDFIDALSSGAALVNYVGHGSAQVLAQEVLFAADDVAALENRGRLGLFVTASCAVAKFDQPLEIGVAEGLVRNASRGALAAYGATTLAFVHPNKELNIWLAESVLPRLAPLDSVNLGLASSLGMAVVEAEATFNNWYWITPYEYELLGDPASVLALPGTPYPSGGPFLRVDLDFGAAGLVGGQRDTLSGKVMDGETVASWFNGVADVLVEGARIVKSLGEPDEDFEPYHKAGPTFYRGEAEVSNGEFAISWFNPYELVTGPGGRVRALAYNDERDALGALAELRVTAPTGPVEDREGPVLEVSFNGGARIVTPGAPLSIRVSDPSGVNLAPVLAENTLFLRLFNEDLDQLADGPIDLSPGFTYEKGSSSTGSAVYKLPSGLPTDEGANSYRVDVSASDNFSNRTTAELTFELVPSSELKLTDVINYPNPFSASTTIGFRVIKEADVVVKIYTVGGRHVRTLRASSVSGWGHVEWDGADSTGDLVSNGVYLYKVTAVSTENSGEKADFIGKAVVLR